MDKWNQLASPEALAETVKNLQANGITPIVVETGQQAKTKVLDLIPEGAEVMTMSSVTLDTLGITKEINESAQFTSVKAKLAEMDRATQNRDMQKLGAAPEYALVSVHAVTQDGH